mmetsp:Transcript_25315/g.68775  ORF Transcript_25315/g.68775 Transcript_25315/m.68775 type:complete len:222 (+) Transcript_25315:1265-1930(+)
MRSRAAAPAEVPLSQSMHKLPRLQSKPMQLTRLVRQEYMSVKISSSTSTSRICSTTRSRRSEGAVVLGMHMRRRGKQHCSGCLQRSGWSSKPWRKVMRVGGQERGGHGCGGWSPRAARSRGACCCLAAGKVVQPLSSGVNGLLRAQTCSRQTFVTPWPRCRTRRLSTALPTPRGRWRLPLELRSSPISPGLTPSPWPLAALHRCTVLPCETPAAMAMSTWW